MITKAEVEVLINDNEKEFGKKIVYRENCKLRHKEVVELREDIKSVCNKIDRLLVGVIGILLTCLGSVLYIALFSQRVVAK